MRRGDAAERSMLRGGVLLLSAWAFFVWGWGETALAEHKVYYDLFSVSFPVEEEGWACGRWGTVLHSPDGGESWERQSTGTDYTLSSVYFVDREYGWAVGELGMILHTQDGGATWEKQESPVPFYLMEVYFFDRERGIIVGEQTHVLMTEDGGATWEIQFTDEPFTLFSVSFCDDQNGWAAGEYSYTYRTRDGGMSWENQAGHIYVDENTGFLEGGNSLFDVKAVSPEEAWAVGIGAYVVRTVDGGETWEEVDTGIPRAPLFCVDGDDTGRVVIGGKGAFVVSSDGGGNWVSPDFLPPATYGWFHGLTRMGEDPRYVTVGGEGALYMSEKNGVWRKAEY